MGISMQLPQEAARIWGDPAQRQRIVDMHARGASLLEMVDELGLTSALDADGLRPVIERLSDTDVQIIRDAFVAEAERIDDAAGANFPVDCRVDNPSVGVQITAVPGSRDGILPVVRID